MIGYIATDNEGWYITLRCEVGETYDASPFDSPAGLYLQDFEFFPHLEDLYSSSPATGCKFFEVEGSYCRKTASRRRLAKRLKILRELTQEDRRAILLQRWNQASVRRRRDFWTDVLRHQDAEGELLEAVLSCEDEPTRVSALWSPYLPEERRERILLDWAEGVEADCSVFSALLLGPVLSEESLRRIWCYVKELPEENFRKTVERVFCLCTDFPPDILDEVLDRCGSWLSGSRFESFLTSRQLTEPQLRRVHQLLLERDRTKERDMSSFIEAVSAIFKHPNASAELREELVRHHFGDICFIEETASLMTREQLDFVIQYAPISAVRLAKAGAVNLPTEAVVAALQDKRTPPSCITRLIAAYPEIPEEVFVSLAETRDVSRMLQHPNFRREALERLMTARGKDKAYLAASPYLTRGELEVFVRKGENSATARQFVCRNPNAVKWFPEEMRLWANWFPACAASLSRNTQEEQIETKGETDDE